jgi:hypothetical protein
LLAFFSFFAARFSIRLLAGFLLTSFRVSLALVMSDSPFVALLCACDMLTRFVQTRKFSTTGALQLEHKIKAGNVELAPTRALSNPVLGGRVGAGGPAT